MKRPNVLFVNLPFKPYNYVRENLTGKRDEWKTSLSAMPMGILYLSSYLKTHNDVGQVMLLDFPLYLLDNAHYASVEDFILAEARKRVDFKPDIIGFSLNFSMSHRFFELAVRTLKSIWPKAIMVAGGVHATNCAKGLLANENLDYVLCGEGEDSFSKMVSQYANNQSIQVKGLHCKGNVSAVSPLALADTFDDLDALEFPDWGLLDMEEYVTASGRKKSVGSASTQRMATILTTRGCPFRCTFCSAHTVHGRRVRYRSVENIVRELKTLHESYGVTLFVPEDDLFTANRERVLSLFSAIADLNIQNFGLQFPNGLNVNTMDKEILDAMIKCGTQVVTLAIESGSEYVQKHLIKKNCDLSKARNLVRLCRERGVLVRCFFIFGFPRETKEFMNETVQYMRDIEADWCNIMIATPLIGSEMYQEFMKKGYIKDNVSTWGNTFVEERTFDTEEISAAELTEFVYRLNLDINFINHVNLRKGNFDRALSLFNDVLHSYPFHIFALYGLYLAYEGNNDLQEADNIRKRARHLVCSDTRARYMSERYGNLIPGLFL